MSELVTETETEAVTQVEDFAPPAENVAPEAAPAPTVGRVVLYWEKINGELQKMAAVVCRVWSEECVNLTVFLPGGETAPRTSVTRVTGSDDSDEALACHWNWPARV